MLHQFIRSQFYLKVTKLTSSNHCFRYFGFNTLMGSNHHQQIGSPGNILWPKLAIKVKPPRKPPILNLYSLPDISELNVKSFAKLISFDEERMQQLSHTFMLFLKTETGIIKTYNKKGLKNICDNTLYPMMLSAFKNNQFAENFYEEFFQNLINEFNQSKYGLQPKECLDIANKIVEIVCGRLPFSISDNLEREHFKDNGQYCTALSFQII